MTTRAMKLLAVVPALLAGAALAQPPNFTNDIPVNAFYEIGSDFELTWSETGTPGTFQLSMSAWNNTPYGTYAGPFGVQLPAYDTREFVLDGALSPPPSPLPPFPTPKPYPFLSSRSSPNLNYSPLKKNTNYS
jgi:hypothetical protein